MKCHCACCDEPSTIGADASYPWTDLVKEWRHQRKNATPATEEQNTNTKDQNDDS